MATRPPERAPDALGVIAATKLQVPHGRRALVPREALVALVAGEQHTRLTLLSAPAGSGKTTLLTLWQQAPFEHRPFAWLSLDRADDDPVRFWTCVVEALQTVVPGAGTTAAGALRSPRPGLETVVLPLLVNELASWEERVVLVLDDLHELHDERIHRSLSWLLDHIPAALHLAIATRSDPDLPLSRLRARDELVELRVGDLRFDDDEALAFLTGGLGLEVGPAEVEALQRRTEGWAAGLQLAGLSLRGRRPGERGAGEGTGRIVVDFVVSEVLDGLRPDLRRVLERIALLERVSPALCSAVTGEPSAVCAEQLREIERFNLFTAAVDPEGRWYRTHALLADALARRLSEDDPALAAEVHRRATGWFAAEGSVPEAVGHALAAGDADAATELVATRWGEFFNRGWLTTVAGWLRALPAERVREDSRLWLAQAWTALDEGALDAVGPWLAAGEDADDERAAWTAILRALHRFKSGDVRRARDELEPVLRAPPPAAGAFWQTVASLVDGLTGLWDAGARAAPTAPLQDARRLALADGNVVAAHYAVGYLALAAVERGDDATAGDLLAEADGLVAREPRVAEHFTAMVSALARGRRAEGAGDRGAAAAHVDRAVELGRRGAGRPELEAALAAQQRLRAARPPAAGPPAAAPLARAARPAAAAPPAAPALPRAPLSQGELRVLRLLPSQLSLREIGGELFVSHNTVKTHTRSIYAKLRVTGRDEAVRRAHDLQLL